MRMLLGLFLLFPIIAAAGPSPVPGARWWGVVVGVSQYPHLNPASSLQGPRNDVPLVLDWLSRQRVPRNHLTVLADHVRGADGLPDRDPILTAINALPARMVAGDIAFLYFAGHGSLQPQSPERISKPDALEEIFLPADVGRWSGADQRVAGAILGNEIGHAVDALRQRGVFVWLVFDSCHSATEARAMQAPGIRVRAVAPEDLGEPRASDLAAARSSTSDKRVIRVARPDLPGGYVAFYAAQTDGVAPELPLPAGERDRRVHGLFTYALLRGLSGVGSYRELAHRILAFYSTTFPSTTPEFEGALDAPIGAPGAPLVPPADWPAQNTGREFHIEAGGLNGLAVGSVLALEDAVPGHSPLHPLGLLRVSRATLTEAWAVPMTDHADLTRWHVPVDRTAQTGAGLVRILESKQDLIVRIAGPEDCGPGPRGCLPMTTAGHESTAAGLARRLVQQPGVLPGGARLTDEPSAADLLLLVAKRTLLIVRPGMPEVDLPHAVAIDLDGPGARGSLQQALHQAVRCVSLMRLGAEFPATGPALTATLRAREGTGQWRSVDTLRTDQVPLAAEIAVRLQNTGPADLSVTVLSLDEHFGVSIVYPVDQESNLLRRGSAVMEVPGWASSPGIFELLVITDEARPGHPHDLSYLAQPGVTRGATGTERSSGTIQVLRYRVVDAR